MFFINRILIFLFKIQIVNNFVYDRKLNICEIGKPDKLYIRAGNSLNYQGNRTFPVSLAFKLPQKERKTNSNLSMEYRVLQGYHYITEPSSHCSSLKNLALTEAHLSSLSILPQWISAYQLYFPCLGALKNNILSNQLFCCNE